MIELLKEDLLGIIKKKRFIIMTALLFLGAVVAAVYTKTQFFNDMTFFLEMKDYVKFVFGVGMGIILIISVYHLKYTEFCIGQVEEKGLKRSANVCSKFLSGCIILICAYALIGLLILLLGMILGAHLSSYETQEFIKLVFWDLVAAVGTYSLALFFLYLFAFPVFPAIVYAVITAAAPFAASLCSSQTFFRLVRFAAAKLTAEVVYTRDVFRVSVFPFIPVLIIQTAIPFFLSMLVFKMKKRKVSKDVEAG